jgi:polar amino acid transport system substrate-binding protein
MKSSQPGLIAATIALLGVFWMNPSDGLCGKTFDRIRKMGEVRIGVSYDRKPYGYFNKKGEWVGFEVDVASEMVGRWKLKFEPVKVSDRNWGSLLSRGKIDAAFCRIRRTRSLESAFDFSVPYCFDSPYIMVLKGKLDKLEELKGQKIAAVQGAPTERRAMSLLKQVGDKEAETNVVSYPDRPSCFLALGREKVAAWVDSGLVLLEYASKKPGRFKLIRASDIVEPVAVALPQDDSAWRDLVNFTLQDMAGDGTLEKIYNKWLGPKTPHHFPLGRAFEVWPE